MPIGKPSAGGIDPLLLATRIYGNVGNHLVATEPTASFTPWQSLRWIPETGQWIGTHNSLGVIVNDNPEPLAGAWSLYPWPAFFTTANARLFYARAQGWYIFGTGANTGELGRTQDFVTWQDISAERPVAPNLRGMAHVNNALIVPISGSALFDFSFNAGANWTPLGSPFGTNAGNISVLLPRRNVKSSVLIRNANFIRIDVDDADNVTFSELDSIPATGWVSGTNSVSCGYWDGRRGVCARDSATLDNVAYTLDGYTWHVTNVGGAPSLWPTFVTWLPEFELFMFVLRSRTTVLTADFVTFEHIPFAGQWSLTVAPGQYTADSDLIDMDNSGRLFAVATGGSPLRNLAGF